MLLTLLLAILGPAPGANLLADDTAFELGCGPFRLVAPAGALQPPRVTEGLAILPVEATGRGASLLLDASPPLEPETVYTLALRARSETGSGLTIAARDGFGRGETGRFRLTDSWRELQLTFTALPAPRDELEAAAAGVDWGRRRVVPGLDDGAIRVSVAIEAVGAAGRVFVDDVRLVSGPLAVQIEPPELAVDLDWGELGPDSPAWLDQEPALSIRAAGPPELLADVSLRDPRGRTVLARELRPERDNRWRVPLTGPGAGCYRVTATVRDGGRVASRTRWLVLLHDRRAEPPGPFLLDREALPRLAEARPLGYRRVRLAAAWRELADDRGTLDVERLDALLRPAVEAGFEVTLAIRLTPAAALPRGAVTERRMDSHGFAKGVPLPDLPRFAAWLTAAAQRYAGHGLVYELDDEAWKSWNAADYLEYLTRCATALKVDPTARLAGAGAAAPGPVPKPVAFLDEVLKRGAAGWLERATIYLPGPGEDAADEALLAASVQVLAARWPAGARPVFQAASRRWPPAAPLDEQLRLVPASLVELSPFQLAARGLRDYLLALRAGPVLWPTGWSGGCGPREAALDGWLTRYAEAAFVEDLAPAAEVRGVLLELPDGRGLAALWDAGDRRWSMAAERVDRPVPELVVDSRYGVPVRPRSSYGRELRETYHDDLTVVPVGFEPTYLEGPSCGELAERLAAARWREQLGVRVAPRLAVRAGRPGVAIDVGGDGPELSGGVRLTVGPEAALLADSVRYLAAGPATDVFVPFVSWPGRTAELRVVAEAGWWLAGFRRRLLAWPAVDEPAPVLDGDDADWPAAVPRYTVASADRLLDRQAEWRGPDDASLTMAGRLCDGALHFWFEVADDRLADEVADPFATGDLIELGLDLDLAGDALEPEPNGDDYRLLLSPIFGGQFDGRQRLVRGPGPGPALLDEKNVRSRLARTLNGYRAEARLPLSKEGRELVEAARVIGLEVLLDDHDGAGRDVRLALFGADGGSAGQAQVWLGAGPVPPEELSLPLVADPWRMRVGFDPREASPYKLTPAGFRGAVVRLAPVTDFVRGDHALRLDTRRVDGLAEVAAIELPADDDGLTVSIWARANGSDDRPPPRLGLRVGGRIEWLRPPERWRRFDLPAPPGAELLELLADGTGRIEVAEVTARRGSPPAAARPARGRPG